MPFEKRIKKIKDTFRKLGLDPAKKKKQDDKQLSLKQNREAIIHDTTPFIIQEAYKTSRTNIIFSVSGSDTEKCKIIALTSANPGEGKTTSCINLSITFAQTGAKVLVIDGDLRKPRVHQYIGVTKQNGLSTVLSKQKTFEEVVYREVRPGLDLIVSGAIPPNPAELLSSDAMHSLLKKLSNEYDYIFIDTPPVAVVTDAAALSKYVSGMVIVVRQDYANHESVEHAINLLRIAEAKILGFFVNDVDVTSGGYGTYKRSYGYKYKYSYKYRYGGAYGYRYGDSTRSSSKKSGTSSSHSSSSSHSHSSGSSHSYSTGSGHSHSTGSSAAGTIMQSPLIDYPQANESIREENTQQIPKTTEEALVAYAPDASAALRPKASAEIDRNHTFPIGNNPNDDLAAETDSVNSSADESGIKDSAGPTSSAPDVIAEEPSVEAHSESETDTARSNADSERQSQLPEEYADAEATEQNVSAENIPATTYVSDEPQDIPATSYVSDEPQDIPATSYVSDEPQDIPTTSYVSDEPQDIPATSYVSDEPQDIPATSYVDPLNEGSSENKNE